MPSVETFIQLSYDFIKFAQIFDPFASVAKAIINLPEPREDYSGIIALDTNLGFEIYAYGDEMQEGHFTLALEFEETDNPDESAVNDEINADLIAFRVSRERDITRAFKLNFVKTIEIQPKCRGDYYGGIEIRRNE